MYNLPRSIADATFDVTRVDAVDGTGGITVNGLRFWRCFTLDSSKAGASSIRRAKSTT
jgi:hypothetical protein